MTMQLSKAGLTAICKYEGFSAVPYKDAVGVLTQGYGHTAAAGGEPLGGTWTKDKAMQVLKDDLARNYEPSVNAAVGSCPLQQCQYDALVSFTYNVGTSAFQGSTLLKKIKQGDYPEAAGQFMRWTKAGGKTLKGLVTRRAAERAMFEKGIACVDEPVTAPIETAHEKIAASEVPASTAAAAGGVIVVAEQVRDGLQQADSYFTSGRVIPTIIGVIIVLSALYAAYCKWVDLGKPNPFYRRPVD